MQRRSHRIDFWKKKRKWKTFHRKRVLGRWFKQNAGYKAVKNAKKNLFFGGSVQELWASLAPAVRSLAADQDQIQSFQNFPSVGLIITPRLKKQCKKKIGMVNGQVWSKSMKLWFGYFCAGDFMVLVIKVFLFNKTDSWWERKC